MKNASLVAGILLAVWLCLAFVPDGMKWPTSARRPASGDSLPRPDSSRFTNVTLVSGLDEPMEMAILPNFDIVIAERKGAVRYYDSQMEELQTIAQLNVFSGIEDGLLGIAADPDFKNNNWLYLYYGLAGDRHVSQLTRYELRGKTLLKETQKILLEIPTQRAYCCHSAGYITFDPTGNLYLSVGDNTNAEEIEGHNPTDERPGHELADDQGTTANSNDLRGKILRIRPEVNGSYSIPDGNLFPKDGSKGRPEIFAMGLRNPFRVSVDPKTGYVYWGDVGPDTEIRAEEGKLSYDEINQARGPGFFGYPYFLGANEAFPKYDFATKKEGPGKNPTKPVNNSPNNTGVQDLPPATPAWIWYGKGPSKRWPLVGKGGASAMAGPVYYRDRYPDAPYRLPSYYDGKLFIFDWIRKWIMAVTMDANGNYVGMEPFLPQLKVVAPIDMQIATDGAIYLLAYGTNWFAKNTNSGIIRVEYAEGNRNPVAVLDADKKLGAAPLTVQFSAGKSRDFDEGDKLKYHWSIAGKPIESAGFQHTFSKPGTYAVMLTVSDNHGGKSTAGTEIRVGNTPPKVQIVTAANRSFYWDGSQLDYHIKASDREDDRIVPEQIGAAFHFLPYGKDLASAMTMPGGLQFAGAQQLYASLDCKACHTLDTKSVGPALKEISKKYKSTGGAADMLARKIITGGSGNWGSYPMPPHADLPEKDARELADYILSLDKKQDNLPLSGKLKLTAHAGRGSEGAYVLQASYTDRGANGIAPLSTTARIVLRNPMVQMEDYDEGNAGVVIATRNTGFVSYIANITNGKFVRFNHIDVRGIKLVRLRIQEQGAGGTVEIRLGSRDGELAGKATIPAGQEMQVWKDIDIPLRSEGFHDLFFVFKNEKEKGPLFHIDYAYFEKRAE